MQFFKFTSYRGACSIPDPDNREVVITGGSGNTRTYTKVSVYNEKGWSRNLNDLKDGRNNHACTSFIHEGKKVIDK